MTDQHPAGGSPAEPAPTPPADTGSAAPPPAQSGWVLPPPPAAPPAGGWVMPPAASARGPVSGLARLGALVLLVYGVLWTLIGLLLIVAGSAVQDFVSFNQDVGRVFTGIMVGLGIGMVLIALGEILTAIFAWRGSDFARAVGIVYALLFGLISLGAVGGGTGSYASAGGSAVMAVFAAGYVYTFVVFCFRWRSAA